MSDLDWMLGVLREDSEVWEQVVWGSCGCPIPECAQGQIGWGHEQPGPVELSMPHGMAGSQMISKVPSSPNHSVVSDSRRCTKIEYLFDIEHHWL